MKLERAYQQTLRAQKARDSEQRLLEVAEALFAREPFDRVTLAAIATGAGVTVPTVQRRFGNKEGIFAAVGERVRARVEGQRGAPPVGDLRACIAELVAHYEAEGALVWHLLRQEQDVPLLAAPLALARGVHRRWVESVFAIPLDHARDREMRVDALVAATDLFVWKLLRLDLRRSRAQVERTMFTTTRALCADGGSR